MNKEGEMSNLSPSSITILGIGNELLSDEGVGVHLAKYLEKENLPDNITITEGGTDGFGLINIITDTDYLIVIDSLKGGSKPGTIYRFPIEDAPSCPDSFKTSVHQIGILEVLNLSELVGKTPETIVFGIEPKTISMGMTLSPEIQGIFPKMKELIMKEIRRIRNQ